MKISEKDIYKIPAGPVEAELKIKGSRFVSSLWHVKTKEEAEQKYAGLKKLNYNATHNCFAFRINEDEFRYSDDGEPSGTAGKPILAAIDGNSIVEVLCVVTRYFGGTKLGTGGLIRAYGDSAALALDQMSVKRMIKSSMVKLIFEYQQEKTVRKFFDDFNGKIITVDYVNNIEMNVTVPQSQKDLFEAKLIEVSKNQIKIEK